MNRDLDTEVHLLLGAKGTGKTDYILGNEEYNIASEIDRLINEGFKKFIILDRVPHPKYYQVPIIYKDQINTFKSGVVRIVEPTKDGMLEALNIINDNVTNTVLIYEDAYRIEKSRLSDPTMCIVSNSKNLKNHIIFMYHGWKFVPLDLLILVDKITMYKINRDILAREEDEFDEKQIAIIKSCFTEVKNHPNPFYNKTIHVSQ